MGKKTYVTSLSHRAYLLSLKTIELCSNSHPRHVTHVLYDQLLRSTTSIGANIVEATAANSRLEFKKYHQIALKSANETKYWLALLKGAIVASKAEIDPLLSETKELANMLAVSVMQLKKAP